MKDKLSHIISKPFYLLLLPAFYFIHRWQQHYSILLANDVLWLILIYTGAAILLMLLCRLWYRDLHKAVLAAFILLAVNFFFGNVLDLCKKIPGGNWLARYSVALPLTLAATVTALVFIKRTKRRFVLTARYLNLLLIVLIIIDGLLLFNQSMFNQRLHYADKLDLQLHRCDTCAKPDIYLLVADEYAGQQELRDIFSFDNAAFDTALQQRGFHIIRQSISNYNSTIYSMASLLGMMYLQGLEKEPSENYKDILYCRELVKRNSFTRFLKEQGYAVYNYSFLDIGNEKRAVQNILPTNRSILAGSTLLHRLRYLFGARFASRQKLDDIKRRELYDNRKVDSLLERAITAHAAQPKFVYAHFNMPHWPYFFDAAGHEIPVDKLTEEYKANKEAYIQYLQYTNNKLLGLADKIIQGSASPPIILLISDHGFRQLPPGTALKYYFMNLSAIHLPSGNYQGFKDGMSNVNLLRTLLNTQFDQGLGPLKDTTQFVKDY